MIRSRFFHILIVAIAGAVVLVATSAAVVRQVVRTPAAGGETHFLYIKPGTGLTRTAWLAHEAGLVKAQWHFSVAVKAAGMERALYAGEYAISPGQMLSRTLEQIRRKDVYHRRVSLPEGLSVAETVAVLRSSFGLEDDIVTLPAEGSLLPDTYFYLRGDKASSLIDRMKKAMTSVLLDAWESRASDLPYDSVEDALVMASIIEKETAVVSERPLVAAVFVNRLRKRMRLQSDPTVIYGITNGLSLGRAISRADLRDETPYNTYRINGLPPTPIANPGIDSIHAALNPADVPYLYFVADGTGGHAFATTLTEHNRNVARWRALQKQSR